MNQHFKENLLIEAIRIGDNLLSQATYDKNGASWSTVDVKWDELYWRKRFIKGNREDIYIGSSGILLFLIELYKQTEDERYKNAVIAGIRWLESYCRNVPASSYAFYTGRMGVVYCLIKSYELLGERKYLETATKIVYEIDRFKRAVADDGDLLNGTAGTLLGLVHLHSVTKEDWLLNKIDSLIWELINSAHLGPKGVYWNRSKRFVRGLCGFSHGVAGTGFVFLQLGHYFQNEAFYWLAEQAFVYENYFYSSEHNNWPDFRRGAILPDKRTEYRHRYEAGDYDYFITPNFMNAWCHGAAGVGLSRICALQLLKKTKYLKDLESAVDLTVYTDIINTNPHGSYTLCHGSGGNAELFIEAYNAFSDPSMFSLGATIAQKAIEYREAHGGYRSGYADFDDFQEDISLFLGSTGVGYFFLRVYAPKEVPSVLMPSINAVSCNHNIMRYKSITSTIADIRRTVLKQDFNRTLFAIEQIAPKQLEHYFCTTATSICSGEQEKFISFVTEQTSVLVEEEKSRLEDILNLETERLLLDAASPSDALLYQKSILLEPSVSSVLELTDDLLLDLNFRISPEVKVVMTSWDWEQTDTQIWGNNLQNVSMPLPVLLKREAEGVIEAKLNSFNYLTLSMFDDGRAVHDVIDEVSKSIELVSENQRSMIVDLTIQQIRYLLQAGFIELKA